MIFVVFLELMTWLYFEV